MTYRKKWILTAAAGSLLTVICLLHSLRSREPVQELLRPAAGEGNQRIELEAVSSQGRYPVTAVLAELSYDEEETARRLEEAEKGLERMFLGKNQDLKHISSELSMPAVWPGTEIAIQWYLESWEYIEPGGRIKNELLKEEQECQVQAVLTLNGQEIQWERRILLIPCVDPDEEQKIRMLEQEIRRQQEGSSRNLILPSKISEESVSWYYAADNRWKRVLILTAVALGALSWGHRKEQEQEEKRRERSLQMDYPDIVSRLSLYMGAGISMKNAWERIVENYEKDSCREKKKHAAYEEMRTALYEMQSGIPEGLAYERFGNRCRTSSYLKLGALLGQNLRRGTRNLAELLEEESREAFEERKALAKKLGEECESRLLLPMLLLLLTVLILVMYPAVRTFQV